MGRQKRTLLLDLKQSLTHFSLHLSLIYLTYKRHFIRNVIRISYILMVKKRRKFPKKIFYLRHKINIFCSEIVTAYMKGKVASSCTEKGRVVLFQNILNILRFSGKVN